MEIQNSLDWAKKEQVLLDQVKKIPSSHAYEARKVLSNFPAMITKLSKLELEARRSASHSQRKVNEYRDTINEEIKNFEQWILLLLMS